MNQQISIRGRTARKMVKVANHMPFIGHKAQTGELREKMTMKEKAWECPEHLKLDVIDMELFKMELLQRRNDVSDITQSNLTDEDNTDAIGMDDNNSSDVNNGIILHLHGGGYYGKIHNTYRDMAALYNEVSDGFDVLSVDYRVAPENPYPASLEDAVKSYEWILEIGYPADKIFIAGDSAGGGLTLALSLYIRDHNMQLPAGIITMSAWTDLTKSGESYQENFDIDPMFGGSTDSLVFKDGYYKDSDPEDPYISPINGDYTGFPPMLMQVGEYEMLLSDTLSVAEKAKMSGVTIKEHVYTGMFHDFQMGLTRYPEAKEAWVEVGRFIRYVISHTEDFV